MIMADHMSLTYGDGTKALIDVNLDIREGEIVYITGPSGSGKTSLLKLILGMEYPTEGHLKVMSQSMLKNGTADIKKLRRSIGPVFQEFKLIKGRTAIENIILGMRFLQFSPREIELNAYNALEKVGLGHKKNTLVEKLSWGESQRIAIARAIARKPKLILADEPTGNLDVDNAINILNILTSLKDERTTVIITTHATHLIKDREEGLFIQIEEGKLQCERKGALAI